MKSLLAEHTQSWESLIIPLLLSVTVKQFRTLWLPSRSHGLDCRNHTWHRSQWKSELQAQFSSIIEREEPSVVISEDCSVECYVAACGMLNHYTEFYLLTGQGRKENMAVLSKCLFLCPYSSPTCSAVKAAVSMSSMVALIWFWDTTHREESSVVFVFSQWSFKWVF